MSNLKFRAWEKPDEHLFVKKWDWFLWAMHYWDDVLFYLHKWVYNPDYEIMQCTWLKDKNWKYIYEWDILKMERVNSDFLMIVSYKIEDKRFSWFWFIEWECEVIGNMYENMKLYHDTVIKNLPF